MTNKAPYVYPEGKTPNERLDFKVDLSKELAGRHGLSNDTILSTTWTVPSGITKDADEFSDSDVTIWLSGGSSGSSYVLEVLITTLGSDAHQRVYEIFVQVNVVSKK